MIIEVILQMSFEFRPQELEGKTTEEKTKKAVSIARARLQSAISNQSVKALLEERVVINN